MLIARELRHQYESIVTEVRRLADAGGVTDDDGIEWPSRLAITQALRWLQRFVDDQLPADRLPGTVVPDGDGGIALEHRDGEFAQRIEIDREGNMECIEFHDCEITNRSPVER